MLRLKNAVVLGLLTGAACTPEAPPAPIAPPPLVTPRVPLPPGGAASSTVLPAYGADGVRVTPNRGLNTEEHIWNFRVALNVAALNCRGGVWDELPTNYNKMLKDFKNTLAIVNTKVDSEYRGNHGGSGKRVRDSKTTELYNYFALPAVKSNYCNTALQKSREVIALPVEREAFRNYAIGGLNDVDRVFLDFYDAYAKYEIDLANWNAQYNNQASSYSQPFVASSSPATNQPAPLITPVPVAVQPATTNEPAAAPEPSPVSSGGVVFSPGTGTP